MSVVARMKSMAGTGRSIKEVSLVSGNTDIPVPEGANVVVLTASATVTISTVGANQAVFGGRRLVMIGKAGTSAITLSNNSATTTKGQMDLGGADITFNAGETVELIQRDDGSWYRHVGGASELSAAELAYLDGVTAGTVTASKAVVVDANKDIGDFRNLDAVNIDAGSGGTAGSVDVFPATLNTGKLSIAAASSGGNFTTTITNASQGGARTYTIPDGGANGKFVIGSVGTATATGGAATLDQTAGKITSESLTTAAGSDYVLTLTNSTIAAADMVLCSVDNGTNTTEGLAINRVTPGSGSVVIRVRNTHASAALNGTIVISFLVVKS